jgi:hypothetical protein
MDTCRHPFACVRTQNCRQEQCGAASWRTSYRPGRSQEECLPYLSRSSELLRNTSKDTSKDTDYEKGGGSMGRHQHQTAWGFDEESEGGQLAALLVTIKKRPMLQRGWSFLLLGIHC